MHKVQLIFGIFEVLEHKDPLEQFWSLKLRWIVGFLMMHIRKYLILHMTSSYLFIFIPSHRENNFLIVYGYFLFVS